jgi:hypothetical protein
LQAAARRGMVLAKRPARLSAVTVRYIYASTESKARRPWTN